MTVNASGRTAKVPFGLVTRRSQACVACPAATAVLTVITIVLAFTTFVVVTLGGVPCPPSKLTVAPLAKAVPVNVKLTVVLAGALFGVMLSTFN